MAEALLNHLYGDRYEAFSAGTEATRVHPLAIETMQRIGIDISGHHSKTVDSFVGRKFDVVITVCDDANESCPFFPTHGRRLHWSLEDPSAAFGTEAERLAVFEKIRDQIRDRLVNQFGADKR